MFRVHAERTIHKLLPFSAEQRECVRDRPGADLGVCSGLEAYQQAPCPQQKGQLAGRFEAIFTAKTCFQALNLALKRLHQNKTELLLVLDHPGSPVAQQRERARDSGLRQETQNQREHPE